MARRSQGISERQKKIMEFLTSFQDSHGYSPSIRQIGDSIGVKSTSLVDYYLSQLTEMGYIEREQHVSRSIRVLRPMYASQPGINRAVEAIRGVVSNLAELITFPVIGRIGASYPIPMPDDASLSYFDAESSVEVARSMLPTREKIGELFALEVDGDSMIDAMVNDGDIVIMRPAQDANNGEMVAVWLDDSNSTTLKYFYREKDRIRLQPANPNMDPIIVANPASLRIMGKVVMVIRQVKSKTLVA